MKQFSFLFLVSLNLLNAGDSVQEASAQNQNNYIHPETDNEVRRVIGCQITGGPQKLYEIGSCLPRHKSQSPTQKGFQGEKHEEPSNRNQLEKKN